MKAVVRSYYIQDFLVIENSTCCWNSDANEGLAIISPLPPVKSGIADYVFEQLEALPSQVNVTVVVDQDFWVSLDHLPNVEVIKLSDWKKQKNYKTVPRIYHLGNNIHHEFVYWELQANPGVLVLHDYCLHHLVTEITLAKGNANGYTECLELDGGEFGRSIAESRISGLWSETYQFLLPANATAIKAAKAVIVHSGWAKDRVQLRFPEVPVKRIPHHFSEPKAKSIDRTDARKELEINTEDLIFVALGFVTPPKQISQVLNVLGDLKGNLPTFHFYIVGQAADLFAVNEEISEHGLSDLVTITGFVSIEEMQMYIKASDVIFNLRYPTAGETSGTLVRAIGEGRAAVIYDYASFSDYPDNVVSKVPLDTIDTRSLKNEVLKLANNIEARKSIESNGKKYINEKHNLSTCLKMYLDFCSDVFA